ncbi:iron complex outermembrane receptor protein [Polymorphobacter fuscus]|nr:TonB-dependent receptor [Polymorphobacter fuscus]NJC08786.1 iron complex outermembrane receptor protein [Polymorphobacter fuscus]
MVLAIAPASARADDDDELVITAAEMEDRVRPPRLTADEAFLIERQPRNVAEMLRFLPGVSAKTNSRGETIARVRGAEERQTQVFLDGAPLAVPWDGRIDLGVLPAGLVRSVEVAKGAVPIEYGTNAVAGAIDLRTGDDATGVHGMAQVGSDGFATGSVVGGAAVGSFHMMFAASGVTRDAEPVADRAALPFSQAADGGRTNTDLDSVSLFGALGYAGPVVAARASLLRVTTRRGIAPESDRDPAVAAPRYWRYPDIDLTQLTLNASADIGEATTLRAVGWRQWFSQSIDAYSNASYTVRRTRQDDEDDTLGARLVLATAIAPFDLRLTSSAQTSRHAQVDTNLQTGVAGPRLVYRQNLFTVGAEVDAPLGPVKATAGVAYDRATTPLTGDKPAQPATDAVAFSLAVQGDVARDTTLTLSGGRRTRFPSARELFGEALGRFLINPDLRPETAWLADIELAWQGATANLVVNPFYQRGAGTIGQRVVRVNGVSLRKRYNQSGTRTYGVDAQANVALMAGLDAEIFGTVMSARADPGDAAFRRLLQRPAYEVGGALRYRPFDALLLRGEYRRVGPAVDLDAAGNRAELAAGDEVNLRAQWRVARIGSSAVSVTMAVDNLGNDVITPQLGLPSPGRMVRFGVRID